MQVRHMMQAIPEQLGRTVYAEVDEAAGPDPLRQAAGWLARFEPWLGPCRNVGVAVRALEGLRATVVSAGYQDDRVAMVHLVGPRPAELKPRWKLEGAAATLEAEDGVLRLSRAGQVLDPSGIALPDASPGRVAILNDALAKAAASSLVETVE
ncbi:hypothetical protein [Geminicoccus harenae]|uniref:hypothetical protein n=1 Tax=Geminicoccus harenae TaxID=2498453 RepID=UPI00168B78CF|nr:hypothetical protein [Geminicoccus harenae]